VAEEPTKPRQQSELLKKLRERRAELEAEHEHQAKAEKRVAQDELIDAAVEWLQGRWGEGTQCPYCGNPNWEVGTPVDIALRSGEALSPHFPVMCTNCGNTVFINAIRAGLSPEPTDQ
jgi:hypothetical protein